MPKLPDIAAPVYKNYADFKASEWYNKVMSRNGVEYIFYEETPGVDNVLLPITKGENVTASETTEKLEVDQWGQSIIDEYVDGKTRITGTVGIFYSASQADVLPTTQDFVGRRFKIIKKVAPGFPGAGIPLLMWDKVASDFAINVKGQLLINADGGIIVASGGQITMGAEGGVTIGTELSLTIISPDAIITPDDIVPVTQKSKFKKPQISSSVIDLSSLASLTPPPIPDLNLEVNNDVEVRKPEDPEKPRPRS